MDNVQTTGILLESDSSHPDAVMVTVVAAYLAAIIGAEVVLVHVEALWGFLGHLVLIPILLIHYAMIKPSDGADDGWRVLPALALVPILRVFSLIMPIQEVPVLYWYIMISAPLLISIVLTMRLLNISRAELGLSRLSAWTTQLPIALTGIPLGGAGYLLLRPDPLIDSFSISFVILGAAILTISTGFIEEIIFRGLLQPLMNTIFGRLSGVLMTSALFAIMYLGSMSLEMIAFMGLVGLFFAWCVERTHQLWGVILAHSLLNIGLLLVLPHY